MLQANIEYEDKGFFGNDYDIIVTGPNGSKRFYGKESRDEAERYYRNEKRLEDEMLLRQKQSELADMQMRELKERERREQEERFRQKNQPIFQRPLIPPIQQPYYDPEYIEWKQEKARKAAAEKAAREREIHERNLQAERRKREEEARKKKEEEQQIIINAKELLQKVKQQIPNKNLSKIQGKITSIELLIQKETYPDSLIAIDMLKEIEITNEAKTLLESIKQLITEDKTGQTTNEINKIKGLIKKGTNIASAEAINRINRIKKIYLWKTSTGKSFIESLLKFDLQLEKTTPEEKKLLEGKKIEIDIREKIANETENIDILLYLSKDKSYKVKECVSKNYSTPHEIRQNLKNEIRKEKQKRKAQQAQLADKRKNEKEERLHKWEEKVLNGVTLSYKERIIIKESLNVNVWKKLFEQYCSGYYSDYFFMQSSCCPQEIKEKVKREVEKRNREIEKNIRKQQKSGCFVATACYDNYDAPEVLVLRAYRDEYLLTNWLGILFVKFYYFISPPLAKQIEKSEKIKKFIREHFLKPIVDKINKKQETKENE